MIRNFCTFFDKNYLTRGLVLYYSMIEHCGNFVLWILCADEESFSLLNKMNLKRVNLLKIAEVEDDRMRAIRSSRSYIEYIWLFGSQLPLYLLNKIGIDMITYIDADTRFYYSP